MLDLQVSEERELRQGFLTLTARGRDRIGLENSMMRGREVGKKFLAEMTPFPFHPPFTYLQSDDGGIVKWLPSAIQIL